MALTKVTLIQDGTITADHLHANHGITTDNIGEGTNQFYTDARVASYLSANNYQTSAAGYFTGVTHDTVGQTLTFSKSDSTNEVVSLAQYIDDTNLARLTSGTVDANTGIATFTRDDATTFTVDFSSLLDNTDTQTLSWADATNTLSISNGNSVVLTGFADASHTHTFASLTSKPTTISGYGITDAITTSNIGSQSVSSATTSTNLGSYYTADDWFRATSDDNHIKFYGNTRQMVFRTDGATEFASGVGGYAFAWMYGGNSSGSRRMLLATDGRLWTNYHGWMDEAFLGKTAKAADSELLDGIDSSQFLRSDTSDSMYGTLAIHTSQVWGDTTQGLTTGSLHLDPNSGTDHAGGAITWGASDASAGTNAQAGIYIRSDGSYGTRMYLSTTDSYATGSKTSIAIQQNGDVNIVRGNLYGAGSLVGANIRSDYRYDYNGNFMWRVGTNAGTTTARHLNLANTTADPSDISSSHQTTGITWGQRTDNNPYYIIRCRPEYNNGYSTHSRLDLSWHTGIEIGAASNYGGTRFFNNSSFTGGEIMRVGSGNSNVYINNTGEAGADFRAPTFYDSNNTAWYTNPAGRSLLNTLQLGGSSSDTTNLKLDVQGNMAIRGSSGLYYGVTTNNYNSWTTKMYASSSTQYFNAQQFVFDNQGYGSTTFLTVNTNGIYAPVYYDSNNSNYYVDPASTSNLNALSLSGRLSNNLQGSTDGVNLRAPSSGQYFRLMSGNNGFGLADSEWTHTLEFSNYGPSTGNYSRIHNNSGRPIQLGSATNQMIRLTGMLEVGTFSQSQTNTGEAWVGRAADRSAGTLTVQLGTGTGRKFEVVDYGWTTVEFSADDSGVATAASSFRAPVFYDSNNTGYYVDPNGTSNVSGFISYSYQGNGNVGNTGSASWHPSGIYSAGHNWLYGGINAGGYSVTNMGDARANIFYDYNDTGYYVDPNSTSRLLYLQMPHRGNGTENILVNNGGSENWRAINVAGGNNNNGIGYSSTSHSVFGRHNMSFHTHSSDSIRFHSNGWDTTMEVEGASGEAWLKGAWRATNYYDKDNTGYYANPNGLSRQSRITLVYNQDNGTPRWDFKAYVVESQHHYAHNSTQTMYIGESNPVNIPGDVRAPIFYDYNNTGYYTDPASTSNIYNLQTNGTSIRFENINDYYINGASSWGSYIRYTDDTGGGSNNYQVGSYNGLFYTRYNFGSGNKVIEKNSTSYKVWDYSTTNNSQILSSRYTMTNRSSNTPNLCLSSTYYASQSFATFHNASSGSRVGYIAFNGTANVSYITSGSDLRLKENIQEWDENISEKFETIQPKTFTFINDLEETTQKGFIAQNEVDKFPEAYPVDTEGYHSFNPSGMVVYLMKAVQEQALKIKELEQRLIDAGL
jgi:hypothetical protein